MIVDNSHCFPANRNQVSLMFAGTVKGMPKTTTYPTMAKSKGTAARPMDGAGDRTSAGPDGAAAPPRKNDMPGRASSTLADGTAVIEACLKTLPGTPGVYRMIAAAGDVLYVGKAKSLKKRVAAYARPLRMPTRIQRMIAETRSVEIVTTHTEVEALLLESNLIKRLKPRYNVLWRDDKSFPYILVTGGHPWPQLVKHRGGRDREGEYFGPFASAGAVNRTLNALQRAFPLRSCSNNIFASRTRPCLQYQIKRCTAPCVGRIDPESYGIIVEETRDFLSGRSQEIQQRLSERMEEASEALKFEAAAYYRDRIRALTQIQAHQDINIAEVGEADLVAAHQAGGQTCIQVFFFRAGQNFGNRTYFPTHAQDLGAAEVLESFLGHFYAATVPPKRVLVSHRPGSAALIAEALSIRAGRRVELSQPVRGARKKLIDHALANARDALARRLSESASQRKLLDQLAALFALDAPPERIEIYDNSHISGANPVGAMVVAGPEGLIKNAYRKFNIKGTGMSGKGDAEAQPEGPLTGGGITPGDDYGMLREVLNRRFSRVLKEDPSRGRGTWPDLVLIDGGAGQLSVALDVFADLGIDDIAVAAIAKGPDRNAGRERIHLPGQRPILLQPQDPVLYFLQRLRDEAHRFAIGSHRARRSRAIGQSTLDEIPGIGPRRKRALLHHFGSAAGVGRAGLADLEAVEGISRTVAKKIYQHFHEDG